MEIDSEFLEQRATSLATVLLTRHRDVIVASPSVPDVGYDLIARIAPKGVASGRMFGIELKARRELSGIGTWLDKPRQVKLNETLRNVLTKQASRLKDLPFPLLYLIFAMDTDDAYFGWLREPEIAAKQLTTPKVELADKWADQTHLQIVQRVNTWYSNRTDKPKRPI